MGALAAICIALGIAPTYVIPRLDHAVNDSRGTPAVESLVPAFFQPGVSDPPMAEDFLAEFHDLGAQIGRAAVPGRGLVVLHRGGETNPVVFAMSTSYATIVLILLLLATFGLTRMVGRGRTVVRRRVWAGGVRELRPEMSYTATGFSNPVRVVFNTFFRPVRDETRQEQIAQHFRSAIRKERKEVHLADRLVVAPFLRALGAVAGWAARVHSGRINSYAAYMLLGIVATLIIYGFSR